MQVLKIHDANVFMNKIPGSMLNLLRTSCTPIHDLLQLLSGPLTTIKATNLIKPVLFKMTVQLHLCKALTLMKLSRSLLRCCTRWKRPKIRGCRMRRG